MSADVLRTRITCCCGATLALTTPDAYSTSFRVVAEAFIKAHQHAASGRVVPIQRTGSD